MIRRLQVTLKETSGWFIIFLLVSLYLGVVFYHFFEQGLINYDEAFFLLGAHTYADLAKTAFFNPQNLFSPYYYQHLTEYYGNVYTTARPIYFVFAAAVDAIWSSEYSTRLLNVISGALIVVFFYRFLDLYQLPRTVKVASTFLLIASPLFLLYTRVGLSQIMSALFFLLSLFYLLNFAKTAQKRYLIVSGLCTAFLTLSHIVTFPLVALLLLYGAFLLFRQRSQIQAYIGYVGAFCFPIFLWELLTRIGVFLAQQNAPAAISQKVVPYTKEIFIQLQYAGKGYAFDQSLYYVKFLFFSDTFIVVTFFIVGLCFAFFHLREARYHTLILFVTIFSLLLSFASLKFPRNIIPLLPLFYVVAALGLKQVYEVLKKHLWEKRAVWILSPFVLMSILVNGNKYINIFNIQTNTDAVTSFIQRVYRPEEIQIYASGTPIWRVYLPGYQVEVLSKDELVLADKKDRKTIAILDHYAKEESSWALVGYEKRLLASFSNNIFRVNPIILDFTSRPEEYLGPWGLSSPLRTVYIYEVYL